MLETKWPNLFVPGAAKAGTTSLHAYLAQHPQVGMASLKEPHYFSRIRPAPHLEAFFRSVQSADDYLALFRDAEGMRVRGEASTSYLWDPGAPGRIESTCSDPRFVVLLRDPVTRAFSHYLNDVREGIEHRTFLAAVEEELSRNEPGQWGVDSLYLDLGYYSAPLQRYFNRFGRDRVLVLVFDEVIQEPRLALREVFRFLRLDTQPAEAIRLAAHNPHRQPRGRLAGRILGSPGMRRTVRRLTTRRLRRIGRRLLLRAAPKPTLDEDLRSRLASHYRDDVAATEELLGRELPWRGAGASTRTEAAPEDRVRIHRT